MAFEVDGDGNASVGTMPGSDLDDDLAQNLANAANSVGAPDDIELAAVILSGQGAPIGTVSNLPAGWDINKDGLPSGWSIDTPNPNGISIIRDPSGTPQGVIKGTPGGFADAAVLPQEVMEIEWSVFDGVEMIGIEANTLQAIQSYVISQDGSPVGSVIPVTTFTQDNGGTEGGGGTENR